MDENNDPKISEVPSEAIEEKGPEKEVLAKLEEAQQVANSQEEPAPQMNSAEEEPPQNLVEFFEKNQDAVKVLHDIKTVVVNISEVPLKEINDLTEHVGKFGYKVVRVLYHPREYKPE